MVKNNVVAQMAFVSRHEPTPEQIELAERAGFELIHVGDRDGFAAPLDDLIADGFQAVCVVHAGLALRCCEFFRVVAVFENGRRPGPDGRPEFFPVALHLYRPASLESSGYYNGFLPKMDYQKVV